MAMDAILAIIIPGEQARLENTQRSIEINW